jgi:hypothetical protein
MECDYGQQGGQYALKVDRFMANGMSRPQGENQWLTTENDFGHSADGDVSLDDDWAAAMAEQAMAEVVPGAHCAARRHLPELSMRPAARHR